MPDPYVTGSSDIIYLLYYDDSSARIHKKNMLLYQFDIGGHNN